MTVDLSPLRQGNATPPYLTVIPSRSSTRDKLHSTRGQALSAITYQVEGYRNPGTAVTAAALYAWAGAEWQLLWMCQRGDDIAGRPWKVAAQEWEKTR